MNGFRNLGTYNTTPNIIGIPEGKEKNNDTEILEQRRQKTSTTKTLNFMHHEGFANYNNTELPAYTY